MACSFRGSVYACLCISRVNRLVLPIVRYWLKLSGPSEVMRSSCLSAIGFVGRLDDGWALVVALSDLAFVRLDRVINLRV